MAEDTGPPPSVNINTFAAGEIAPALYGRTDLTKFHQSAALIRNMFVDYKGGVSSRPGTQFIGNPGSPGFCRLIPFQFSTSINQSYILVFSEGFIRFIRNTGAPYYPNGADSGFILSGGSPYVIPTPYLASELRALDYLQITDRVVLTHRNHPPMRLSRLADTNWTLTPILTGQSPLPAPEIVNISISPLPANSTDPQKTRYIYGVTAVDVDGNESSNIPTISSNPPGIDIGATQGTVTVFWNQVAGAQFYKVYKGIPCSGDVYPDRTSQLGFVGFSYGTIFTDGNIVPDFTLTPPLFNDPFAGGQVIGFSITSSSSNWPVGGTTVTISGDGSGAAAFPVLDNNIAGGVGAIKGLYIFQRGSGYTTATITALGGGSSFVCTLSLSPMTGINPAVVSLIDQRLVYASTTNKPLTLFGSRPNAFNDFRVTNPVVDSDSFEFTIASRQANSITWLEPMPGGLVIGTDARILQLTGGSSSPNNPAAITPTAAVIVPQSSYGGRMIDPIVIDYDILYVQSEDSIIRALSYSFYVNIYTGTDITAFSSHLFSANSIVNWAYQDSPHKVIWTLLDGGTLLSLTFFKAQEIVAWARHDTNGFVEDLCVVREGNVNAIYLSVVRNGQRCIERLCERYFYAIDDAWCLDAALSTVANYPTQAITLDGTGPGIVHGAVATPLFTGADFGKTFRFGSAKGVVQSVDSPIQITISFFGEPYTPTITSIPGGFWRLDSNVSTVSGLGHIEGQSVMALVDGVPQGPFTVSSGSITLTTPGSSVVVGLPYVAQLQTNYLDVGGEQTIQGRRKKLAAVTLRVKDSARVRYGTQFDRLQEFVQGASSTDPVEYWPFIIPPAVGLSFGDIRQVIDPIFNRTGSVCIQQDQPLPLTVLAAIPEIVPGDAK